MCMKFLLGPPKLKRKKTVERKLIHEFETEGVKNEVTKGEERLYHKFVSSAKVQLLGGLTSVSFAATEHALFFWRDGEERRDGEEEDERGGCV